ncbi:MAG: AMP-binding protein [Acuticoccus sp.]
MNDAADGAPDFVDIPARPDKPDAAAMAAAGNRSVLTALVAARRKYGPDAVAVEDGDRRALTYTRLLRAVAALSRVIRREVKGDVVGILLPSSTAAAVAYFAVLAAGKTPAMLNFTAGRGPITAACRLANVSAVVTAQRFITLAKLEPLLPPLGEVAPVMMLEDVAKRVGVRDKAFALLALPLGLLPKADPDSAAAIVFTSGAEGDPKGVVLTHRNFLSNIAQVAEALPLDMIRVFFNPLPVFHSFGLGPGLILPLVTGLRLVLHPSPLRAKEIAQRIAETKANILLTTDTFLRQYARAGEDGSLSSLQFAICGAERVRHETRELVRSRFGFDVLEGYGVTETAPVLAVNHPADIRDGTVGQTLPGIELRLVAVEGLDDGRRLLVRGPNIMAGYLDPATGAVVPPKDGWHDTGDVVVIEDGCLVIRGRLKRFAKIGGEMTSLVVVEQAAGVAWPQSLHAAAVVPGTTRGEQIVLLTEEPEPDPAALQTALQAQGLPPRYLPSRVITVEAVPLLGTGKVDYVSVSRMAAALTQEAG